MHSDITATTNHHTESTGQPDWEVHKEANHLSAESLVEDLSDIMRLSTSSITQTLKCRHGWKPMETQVREWTKDNA